MALSKDVRDVRLGSKKRENSSFVKDCSQNCNHCCSQCFSCCSESCANCRQRVRQKWREFNDKLRSLSNVIWPGPLGAALNISSVVFKRVDTFMWGYNDPDDVDHYYYPDFQRYSAALRFPLIIIGGGLGTYMVCCGVNKDKLKAFLRALPVGFSLTMIAEQAVFNEMYPDSNHIDDYVFYPTVFLAALGLSAVTAYRFSRANKTSLKKCCTISCKDRALYLLDNFTRALFYASFLSIPAGLYFDGQIEDPNESFQRAWESSAIGGAMMTLVESCFLDPKVASDSPIIEIGVIIFYMYEMITRLSDSDNPKLVAPEVVIWIVLTLLTPLTLCQIKKLPKNEINQQDYRQLTNEGELVASASFHSSNNKDYFRQQRALVSAPTRKARDLQINPTAVVLNSVSPSSTPS